MSNHFLLDGAPLDAGDLIDAEVYGQEDEFVGRIAHVHEGFDGDQIVVDVGGFLGIGSKRVAMTARQLTFIRDQDGIVYATASLTKEQARELPEHVD